ncbi:MAG: hypothetical protein LBC96_02940 [Lachnospiraceae bacterium]|nr:hypothetical protein [Lachnospiraceae bacterium]
MKKRIANSELRIAKNKREFLTYNNEFLVPCRLEEKTEYIELLFNTSGLEYSEHLINIPWHEKLRFLINCARLDELFKSYEAGLSPDNIMVDINLNPRIIIRDIKVEDDVFLKRYKALIGTMLYGRSYNDYLELGKILYRKNALLKQVSACDTTQEIVDMLTKHYNDTRADIRRKKTLINKKEIRISRITLFIMAIVLVATLFYSYINIFQTIPYQEKTITAYEAYIEGDFLSVTAALSSLATEQMNNMSKYILSRSYVISEGLTAEQRDSILRGLTMNTDPLVFDYWISVGRLDFNKAIDIAARLGDHDFLLFAYMKQEIVVKNDTTMSGDEKTALLNELETKIKSLSNVR